MTPSGPPAGPTADGGPRDVLHPLAHDGRSRLAGLLFWVVLPVVALVVLAAAGTTFARRVDARPKGVTGVYVAELRSCNGNVCQVAGTFTSDDGSLVAPNVLGDYRLRVGDRRTVVLNPQAEIIALPAKWNPTATVVGMTGALGYLAVWGGFAIQAGRRRRTASSG